MSSFFVALVFGIGVSGWVYSQLSRRSGNANPSSTLMAAGGAGLVALIVLFTILKFMLHM